MPATRLARAVAAIRLRHGLAFLLVSLAVYLLALRPWMTDWGATAAERAMALPGDELLPEGAGWSTLAITVDAPPAAVWPWLVQVGQDRAGFYSYTWLENLVGADIHNVDEIRPEWQHLAVGDAWRLVPADYLGGVGRDAASPVLLVEPGRALVVDMFGAHVLEPRAAGGTRLLVRGAAFPSDPATALVAQPIVFTMYRRMLYGLKARAEGRPDSLPALVAMAGLGWGVAGIAVAGLFLARRRRWPWLALPILAALPALGMAHDALAALAAFLAVGIVVLGFLILGRAWWGTLLVLACVVMLTLLVARDAFAAIGLGFLVPFAAVLRERLAPDRAG